MSTHTRNGLTLSLAVLALIMASSMPWQAQAGDNVTIRLPAPPLPPIPKITLRVPPPMVWLPIPQVYVARDTPHQIFYHEDRYYLFHEDRWYVGPGYEGPWAIVHVGLLPPGLRAYRARDWDDYQREAYRRHRDHDDDDHHHAFYGHRGEHNRYERVRWADWKRDNGDRGWHGRNDRSEGRGEDRGAERGEDRGHGRGHRRDD